jgi:DNA-damage-inducible protein J
MATVNITIRIDEKDKVEAEKLFSEFGLTMNAAFNMFTKQAIREQAIPFKIKMNNSIKLLDKNTLDNLSDKSDKKYTEAYEELIK